MKYAITLFAGYYAPAILNHINIDICLGIAAGALLGLLLAMLFVGPTPTQKPHAQTRKPTQRKPRRIIEQTAPQAWTFTPVNYPQGAYA